MRPWTTLTIHYDRQLQAAIKYILHQQSLKSRVTQGEGGGVGVCGCRGSVAERWRLKPEALGSIPSGTTFLSFLLLFQRSLDSNGPDCLRLDNHYLFSDCGRVPSIGLPML